MHPLIQAYQDTNQFGIANGLELTIVEPGKIQYSMTFGDQHAALPEVVHGGAISGLMDAVLSVAAFSKVAD